MRVELQLNLDTALALHEQSVDPTKSASPNQSGALQIKKAVKKLGLHLVPIHPGQTHPLLAPYFMIETPDRRTAERVIDLLKGNENVEAAYLKPDEEPP